MRNDTEIKKEIEKVKKLIELMPEKKEGYLKVKKVL
jgi:Asp-tRNA(Asn)/Glu-tRNA(Gln) amidotransferase C subunit